MNKKVFVTVCVSTGFLAGKAIEFLFSKKKGKTVSTEGSILGTLKFYDHRIVSRIDRLLETGTENADESKDIDDVINEANCYISEAEKQVKYLKSNFEYCNEKEKDEIGAIDEMIRDLNGDIYQLTKLRANARA